MCEGERVLSCLACSLTLALAAEVQVLSFFLHRHLSRYRSQRDVNVWLLLAHTWEGEGYCNRRGTVCTVYLVHRVSVELGALGDAVTRGLSLLVHDAFLSPSADVVLARVGLGSWKGGL